MSSPTTPALYPVHVDADLDPGLSRGLWLVKWLLVIPHYLVLAVLWVAFAVTSVLAFFSILFTARYPRALFDFNVGVMRWSWRVAYYAYGALGTDRYPPFTLAEVPDYPAHLEVDYPERLSRGLVLVKWWLLAIPHYLVVGLLAGGVGYTVSGFDEEETLTLSLIGLLVLVAGVLLLFTGRYPQQLFDLVLGLNRWVLRVAGYVALMTDRYPPFRLDQGGHEGPAVTMRPADAGPGTGIHPGTGWPHDPAGPAGPAGLAGGTTERGSAPPPPPPSQPPAPPSQQYPAAPPPRRGGGWTAGRVVSLVLGSLSVVLALGLAAAGITLAVADQVARDDDGFLMSQRDRLGSEGYALTSEDIEIHTPDVPGWLPDGLVGDVRVTAVADPGATVFLGVARAADVDDFLAGVRHDELVSWDRGEASYGPRGGDAEPGDPRQQGFWDARATGEDPVLTWTPRDGDWTLVMMNADGSEAVGADVSAGAEVPALTAAVVVLLVLAGLGLLVGAVLVLVPVTRAGRD